MSEKQFGAPGAEVRYRNAALGGREVRFRLPNDSEWVAYERRQSRAKDIDEGQALGAEFLDALAVEPHQLEPSEADWVLARLSRFTVESTTRDGDDVVVKARVFLGVQAEMRFRVPSLGRLQELMRQEAKADVRARVRETFFGQQLAPDGLKGYAGAVPIYHKSAAVFELESYVSALAEEEEGDFFDSAQAKSGAAGEGS